MMFASGLNGNYTKYNNISICQGFTTLQPAYYLAERN